MRTDTRSASGVKTLLTCPRKWHIQKVEGYVPREDPAAFTIGSMFHLGAEGFWKGLSLDETEFLMWWDRADDYVWDGFFGAPFWVKREVPEDKKKSGSTQDFWGSREGEVEFAKCLAYIRGYYHKYEHLDEELRSRVVEVESEFGILDAPSYSPGVTNWIGKIDVLARDEYGYYFVIEHKTANARMAKDLGSPYWQQLIMDPQIAVYAEAVRIKYKLSYIPETLYDVVLKSTTKPLLKKQVRKRKAETEEEFDARKTDNLKNLESLEDFQVRLDSEYRENGDQLYLRKIVITTLEKHDDRMRELNTVYDLAFDSNTRYSRIRNTGSCMMFNNPCPNLQVCRGVVALEDAPNLKKKEI